MSMSNKTYDILKYIAQIVLPALGALYFALTKWWPLPYGAEVVGTITAIDTFLGALLKISSNNYEGDGVMFVDDSDPEKSIYRMELNSDIELLGEKDSVTFAVRKAILDK